MPAPVDDAEEQIAQLADERVRCRLMRVAAGVTLERRVDLLELLEHLGAHCASVRPVKTDARGAPAQLRSARGTPASTSLAPAAAARARLAARSCAFCSSQTRTRSSGATVAPANRCGWRLTNLSRILSATAL